MVMIRNFLRPATTFMRSLLGTNGMAAQIATIEAKIDDLSRDVNEFNRTSLAPLSECAPTLAPLAPPQLSLSSEDVPAERVGGIGFVSADLPNGVAYQLSVEQDSGDPWHAGVLANSLQETTWQFLMGWLK